MQVWVPLAGFLGTLDLKKPDAAMKQFFYGRATAKFFEQMVQIFNLVVERGIAVDPSDECSAVVHALKLEGG